MANRIKRVPESVPAIEAVPEIPPAEDTVGLDIGYGEVKAVRTHGDPINFPSIWGRARQSNYEEGVNVNDYPGDILTDDDGTWWVGRLAHKHLGVAESSQLRGRSADEKVTDHLDRARLMKAALSKLYPDRQDGEVLHIRLATGLPVDHMKGADDLRDALLGQHLIRGDKTRFVANIKEVLVMPQPYGTIYSSMLMPDGQLNVCHVFKRTGVVDLGTYSIDLAVDDDGEFVDKESGSVEGGIHMAQDYMSRIIERKTGQIPAPSLVEEVLLKKCLRIRGEVVNMTDEVDQGYGIVRRATMGLITKKWGAAAFIDTIFLTGAPISVVTKTIRDAGYTQAVEVSAPSTANARGYLQYALSEYSRD